jgi:hypothetical protein
MVVNAFYAPISLVHRDPRETVTVLPNPLAVGDKWQAPLVRIDSLREGLARDIPELRRRTLIVSVGDPTGREFSARFEP